MGGLISFLWSAVSWAILPWHERTYLSFRDQQAVARVLVENALQLGVYALPYPDPIPAGTGESEARASQAAFQERFKTGPIVFAAVQTRGVKSMTLPWIVAICSPIFVAALVTWMLMQTAGLGYWKRVAFVTVLAITAGILGHLPNWNWWGFSSAHTAQALADLAEGWFLAGLVIAWVVGLRTQIMDEP